MGKFKVGDRVRRVTRSDRPSQYGEVGNEYTVLEVPSEHLIVVVDGCSGAMARAFELVAPTITIEPGKHYRLRNGKVTGRTTVGDIGFEALVDGQVKVFDRAGGAVFGGEDIVEAWVPKVGERVVEAAGKRYDLAQHWRDYWSSEEGDLVGESFVVTRVQDTVVNYSNKAGGRGPQVLVSDLEPLLVAAPAQPAVLTIEAGKFYRTRDGRKVGPMEHRGDDGHFYWRASEARLEGYASAWCKNGSFYTTGETSFDLIALWQDEPAVVVAASNDNAPAKPKFKVGDRVRLTADNPESPRYGVKGATGKISSKSGNGWWIDFDTGPHAGDHWSVPESVLASETSTPTAIVALIENGAPKPATKPKVHNSQADATVEAERLALAYPGQQFGVFVLADSMIADEVITKTAVLRAA